MRLVLLAAIVPMAASLACCARMDATTGAATAAATLAPTQARATATGVANAAKGTVTFSQRGDKMLVLASVSGLTVALPGVVIALTVLSLSVVGRELRRRSEGRYAR